MKNFIKIIIVGLVAFSIGCYAKGFKIGYKLAEKSDNETGEI